MGKLNKYLKPKVVVERGEYVRDNSGRVMQVSKDMPTHDDNIKVTQQGIEKVKKGQGGLELEDINSVVSATQENRRQKDSSYTVVDDSIKLRPIEVQEWAFNKFGIKVRKPTKSSSFSKAITIVKDTVDAKVKKYNEAFPETTDRLVFNASKANKEVLQTLPQIEDIYEQALQDQEARKIPVEQSNAQFGMDNTVYKPQLKSKFLLQQKQDLDKVARLENGAEEAFRKKYGTSSHMIRMRNDPNYEKKILDQAKKNPQQLNYPANDTRRADYVAPNNRFMYPNLKGEAEANMVNQTNEFIAGELAGAMPLGASKALTRVKNYNATREPFAAINKGHKFEKEVLDHFETTMSNPKFQERLDDLGAKDFKVNAITFDKEKDTHFNNVFNEININEDQLKLLDIYYRIDGKAGLDHELGHAIQKNLNVNKNRGKVHTSLNDILSSNFSAPTVIDDALLKLKKKEGMEYLTKPNAVDNYLYFSDSVEPYAHARELRSALQSQGYIKDQFDEIPTSVVERFIHENPKNRIASFIDTKVPYNVRNLTNILNQMPSIAVGAGIASQVDNKQVGGELEKRIEKGKKWFKKKDSEGKYPKTKEVFTAQAGTKTKLKPYPYMKGSRPALGTTSGRSIESLDGRTISMDQIYDADSVEVQGDKAKTFYKSKLQKYVKK